MSKLETQINQIFLIPKDSNKVSLILFEEKLTTSNHLFLIAELRNVQKKTEANDLSKIAEIIIESFKASKKMSADAMFDAILPDINNKLADFAHKGRKSWLGKFSGLIALKSDRDFYLANTGHTCAWLKRKNGLNEIVGPDKAETHPLKTFQNFSSGRLTDKDDLVLATSSIFNYISVELFSKTLNSNELEDACPKIADILKSSARSDEGFAVFMLAMNKKAAIMPVTETPAPEPAPMPVIKSDEPRLAKSRAGKNADGLSAVVKSVTTAPPDAAGKTVKPAAPIPPALPASPIYAPLPEDLEEEKQSKPAFSFPKTFSKPSLPKISFNKEGLTNWLKALDPRPLLLRMNFPKINFLPSVSGPAKFFLTSFILFAVLFGLNIAAYSVRKSHAQEDARFNSTAEALVNYLSDAESALLYKNQSQAMKLMASAQTELHKLEQLDAGKSAPFEAKFEEMDNKINRVTVIRNLTSVYEAPYPITYISKAGSGFLVSNENPNSLGMFQDNALTNIFLLNSTDGNLHGIAHVSGVGNFVASKDKIYLANGNAQEFQQMAYTSNADLVGLKFVNPNRLYSIDKTSNQVLRWTVSGANVSGATNLLKTTVNLQGARDLAVDNDIFVLYADRVEKYSPTGQPIDFTLSPLSEAAQQMTKIRVGNQLYILEPIANRILIYSRAGELMNQIKFPELSDMKDIFIDEGTRELMVVNGSKIYRITF